MEFRIFTTKSRFLKWFQKGKFRSYYRVRFGQLVIEARRIKEEQIVSGYYRALSMAQADKLITIEEVKQ